MKEVFSMASFHEPTGKTKTAAGILHEDTNTEEKQ